MRMTPHNPISEELASLLEGGSVTCRQWAEQDLGPYYLDGQPVRRDITEDRPGVPLGLGPRQTGEGFRESHIAFTAPDRDAVHAFFEAARSAGAEVLHEPRVWPEYHATYFGAFVRDPDGNNVEAVCHTPED